VVFIEHRGLYWTRGRVADEDGIVPLGKAAVVRAGSDVTVVASARMLTSALEAASELASERISVEVVDPRSLAPLDIDTIVTSVKKTSRLIIAHEAVEHGGMGAEIAARVQQHAFYHLDGPIIRVAAPFAPVAATPALEKLFLPGKDQIIGAVRKAIAKQ
jgi:pyruvate dehydrogenase E1 component beta subunit